MKVTEMTMKWENSTMREAIAIMIVNETWRIMMRAEMIINETEMMIIKPVVKILIIPELVSIILKTKKRTTKSGNSFIALEK